MAKDKKRLELAHLGLVDADIVGLAEVIKTNKTIASIDLSFNKITAVGANALADALRINDCLATDAFDRAKSNFYGNKFGREGISAIIKAFDETRRFAHCVNLGEQGLAEEDLRALRNMSELISIMDRSKVFFQLIHPAGAGHRKLEEIFDFTKWMS